MKKIAVIVSMCCSALSINSDAKTQVSHDVVRARMQQEGFTLEQDVTLLPAEKIMAPNHLSRLWVATSNAHQSQASDRERIEELLQLGHVVPAHYKAFANNHDRNSPILRKNIAEIHMVYSFMPVPDTDISKRYGFAACGTFHHGWTGVTEYFQKQNVGNCAYTEYNLALAHASAQATNAVVRYDVNNKITTVHVEGSQDLGYLYTVAWMDANYFRTLECVAQRDAENVTARVIALAQHIDNQ